MASKTRNRNGNHSPENGDDNEEETFVHDNDDPVYYNYEDDSEEEPERISKRNVSKKTYNDDEEFYERNAPRSSRNKVRKVYDGNDDDDDDDEEIIVVDNQRKKKTPNTSDNEGSSGSYSEASDYDDQDQTPNSKFIPIPPEIAQFSQKRVRNMWQFAAVSNFFIAFGGWVGMTKELSLDEFESSLNNCYKHPEPIASIHTCLLRTFVKKPELINVDNYDHKFKSFFKDHWKKMLNLDGRSYSESIHKWITKTEYKDSPASFKLNALHEMCCLTLSDGTCKEEVKVLLKKTQADLLRLMPLGRFERHNYWYCGGSTLWVFREENNDEKDLTPICTSIEELEDFIADLHKDGQSSENSSSSDSDSFGENGESDDSDSDSDSNGKKKTSKKKKVKKNGKAKEKLPTGVITGGVMISTSGSGKKKGRKKILNKTAKMSKKSAEKKVLRKKRRDIKKFESLLTESILIPLKSEMEARESAEKRNKRMGIEDANVFAISDSRRKTRRQVDYSDDI